MDKPIAYEIHYLSENALSVDFGNSINEITHQRLTNLHHRLQAAPFDGYVASVPAYSTLTVFFDPVIVFAHNNDAIAASQTLLALITELLNQPDNAKMIPGPLVNIPICYGGEFGPDLAEAAALHNVTEDELVQIHSNAVYRVYMIGFVPGFTYLGGLQLAKATPRKLEPRNKVPAGSVGLAGFQTGIYSLDTPGGWQIIGQTPLRLFDSRRTVPALLKAGDKVKFTIISPEEFKTMRLSDDAN